MIKAVAFILGRLFIRVRRWIIPKDLLTFWSNSQKDNISSRV